MTARSRDKRCNDADKIIVHIARISERLSASSDHSRSLHSRILDKLINYNECNIPADWSDRMKESGYAVYRHIA